MEGSNYFDSIVVLSAKPEFAFQDLLFICCMRGTIWGNRNLPQRRLNVYIYSISLQVFISSDTSSRGMVLALFLLPYQRTRTVERRLVDHLEWHHVH